MPSNSTLACILALCAVSSNAFGSTFLVTPTLVVGEVKGEAQAVTELIKSAVPMAGKHNTVENSSEADFTLEPKLIRLGSAFSVTLAKRNKSGVVFSGQMKAANAEEIDLVVRRLTRSVITETPMDHDAPVGGVVETEKGRLERRTVAPGRWVLGLGPSGAVGLGRAGSMMSFTGGRIWQVSDTDAVRLMADLGGSMESESNAGLFAVGLGATHAFSDDNITPYLGGELGIGNFENAKGSSKSGLVLTAVAGLDLWRSSTVGMNVEFRVRTLAATIEGKMPVVAGVGVNIAY